MSVIVYMLVMLRDQTIIYRSSYLPAYQPSYLSVSWRMSHQIPWLNQCGRLAYSQFGWPDIKIIYVMTCLRTWKCSFLSQYVELTATRGGKFFGMAVFFESSKLAWNVQKHMDIPGHLPPSFIASPDFSLGKGPLIPDPLQPGTGI